MTVQEALELLNRYLIKYGYTEQFTLDMNPADGVGLTSACIKISIALRKKKDFKPADLVYDAQTIKDWETAELIDEAQNILDDYFCKIWEERERQEAQQQPAPPVVERPQAPQQQAPAMTVQEALELLNTYLQDHRDQRRFTLDMDPMKGVDLAVEFIAISSAFRHAEDYENSQLIFIAQSILDDYFSQKWAEENDPEEIAKKAQQQAPQVQQPQQQPAPPVVERPQAAAQPQQRVQQYAQAPARPQAQPAAQRGIPLNRLPLGQFADPAAAEVYRAIHGASYRAPAAPYQATPAPAAAPAPAPKAKKTKQEKPAAPKKEKKHKQSIWSRIFHREQSAAAPAVVAPQPVNPSPSAPTIEEIVLPPSPPSLPQKRQYLGQQAPQPVLYAAAAPLPEVNYVAPSVMDAPALYVPTMQLDQVQYALNIINALPPMKEQGLVLTKESRDWNMVFGALGDAFDYCIKLTIEEQDVILKALDVLQPYFDQIQKRKTALTDSTTSCNPRAMPVYM